MARAFSSLFKIMAIVGLSWSLQACAAGADLTFPPRLPVGQTVATDTSDDFLKGPATLDASVEVARTPPTIDFL